MKTRKTFDQRMEEGGLFFYLIAALGALGFYGFIWLALALGTIAGLN
jgi:hypothetical protein